MMVWLARLVNLDGETRYVMAPHGAPLRSSVERLVGRSGRDLVLHLEVEFEGICLVIVACIWRDYCAGLHGEILGDSETYGISGTPLCRANRAALLAGVGPSSRPH